MNRLNDEKYLAVTERKAYTRITRLNTSSVILYTDRSIAKDDVRYSCKKNKSIEKKKEEEKRITYTYVIPTPV